ncbi:hypothetical protein CC86DRAFT_112198 [Ophiobolus disseminans]|uniref:Uncharacterized protein n=1 Tax=Ophiobolus disseminans TaxID=1469910 RepID=A0A6A6ZJ80_9PLEO|nr:hypothetical protein CC86DRAFT_112198 [Ophiobolus disseminans]
MQASITLSLYLLAAISVLSMLVAEQCKEKPMYGEQDVLAGSPVMFGSSMLFKSSIMIVLFMIVLSLLL